MVRFERSRGDTFRLNIKSFLRSRLAAEKEAMRDDWFLL